MSAKRLPKAIRQSKAGPPSNERPPAAQQGAGAKSLARPDEPPPPASGQPSNHENQATRPVSSPGVGPTRRWLADRIVERYATYSAAGGFIPLPILNVGGVVAINIRMVKALSDHYGLPFERDRARAIIVGLAAGTMPAGLASVATLLLLPASSIIALGVSSVAAAACTRSTGQIFVEHFENAVASS